MREWIELLATPGFVFEEAVSFFGDKLPIKQSEFYQLAEEYRAQAFTISGYSKIQILRKFHEELLKAIEEGTTLEKFRDQMNDWLERRGYEGITNFQADNIFRTNVQT
ncbi:phage head morphogenesis protein, partial [Paenibacillus dendritiformis]